MITQLPARFRSRVLAARSCRSLCRCSTSMGSTWSLFSEHKSSFEPGGGAGIPALPAGNAAPTPAPIPPQLFISLYLSVSAPAPLEVPNASRASGWAQTHPMAGLGAGQGLLSMEGVGHGEQRLEKIGNPNTPIIITLP